MATSPSPLPVLLQDSAHLDVESLHHTEDAMVLVAGATGDTASCPPLCGVCSCHVHSQYGRTLRDLPWQGVRGRVALRTRRFYCRPGNCRRKIFSERFPNLTVAYGRQTNRHAEVLQRIGYALGGQAGFHLASELGLDSSPDTILRILKRNAGIVLDSQVKVLRTTSACLSRSLGFSPLPDRNCLASSGDIGACHLRIDGLASAGQPPDYG